MIGMLEIGLIHENVLCVCKYRGWFGSFFLTGDLQSTSSSNHTYENVLLTSQRDSQLFMDSFILPFVIIITACIFDSLSKRPANSPVFSRSTLECILFKNHPTL